MSQVEAPRCQWDQCGRTMYLVKETEDFWSFECGCGTRRVLLKQSVKDRAAYEAHERMIEQLKEHQQRAGSRPVHFT